MWDTHNDFYSCAWLSQIGFKVEHDFKGCNLLDKSEETEATTIAVAEIRGRWGIPDMEPIINNQYHKNLSSQYQAIFIQPNTDINNMNSMITHDAKDYNDTNCERLQKNTTRYYGECFFYILPFTKYITRKNKYVQGNSQLRISR